MALDSPVGDDQAMAVDTKRVKQRRTIRLSSLDELRSEVRGIATAERDRRVARLGNWSPGQCFDHLATWIDYAYGGQPALPTPLFLRLAGPLLKPVFLSKGFPAGVRFPVEGGTYGTADLPIDVAERRLCTAIDRLDSTEPPGRHPFLGRMSHEDWRRLHLRHAELHLSFLDPR
jgi:hypothetical protein